MTGFPQLGAILLNFSQKRMNLLLILLYFFQLLFKCACPFIKLAQKDFFNFIRCQQSLDSTEIQWEGKLPKIKS